MKIPGNKTWRHLQDGIDVHPTNEKDKISIVSLEGEIISLVRPGHIVPIHEVNKFFLLKKNVFEDKK